RTSWIWSCRSCRGAAPTSATTCPAPCARSCSAGRGCCPPAPQLARTARPPPATGNPAEIRQANYQDLVSLPSVWREAGNDVVDKLAVDVVFSLITAIPFGMPSTPAHAREG